MVRSLVAMAALCGLAGVAQAQSSPSDFTNAVRYDVSGQVTGTIAANAMGSMGSSLPFQAVRNSYDASGRLIKVETGYLSSWQSEAVAPAAWTEFTVLTIVDTTYDAIGRKTSEAVSGVASNVATIRQFTQYSYDAVGRLECTAVRMNPASFGSLATGACSLTAASTTYGEDRITRNVYDAAGQVLKVQKAYGTSLQQDYATYEYTANGKPKAMIDANGNRAEMAYDGLDRQTEWHFPEKTGVGSASASDYEAYGYDANGNRTSLRKRDGRTISYAYDALNRVIAKTYPNGGARGVYYSYDLRGLQTAARFDSATGGDAVTGTWDGFGRQASSTTAMSGTSRTLSYAYNADGARSRITWPDANYANSYRYDSNQMYYTDMNGSMPLFHPPMDMTGRVYGMFRWNLATGGWGQNVQYVYDDLSRVASTNQQLTGGTGNVVTGFGYNPASQMVSKSRDNDTYAFNAYVNVSRSYARNGLNQYTSAGPATFNYDANGNLTSDGTTSYGYDIENRLTSASNGAGLVYDPLGRLYETSLGGGSITRFLYDADALVGEYDASGNMLKRYVHGDGEDDPLVEYSGPGVSNPAYLFADHQGSIVARTDVNGGLLQINRYDEYGIPGTGNAGRFQYTGQAWIPELGMYYYKARIYSPTLGRFLQTDPIGYADQNNLYAYVANDPVNGRDPTGTEGVIDDVVNWGKMVASDIVELGKGLARGDLEWALGGMPPTLGGGVVAEVSSARAAVSMVRAELRTAVKTERTFQTYTKTNARTGQVYTGRTSGTGTPAQNVARRDAARYPSNEYGPAKLDKSSGNPQAIRGREQQMIERNGGAQSQNGTSGNRINGISDRNPGGPACRVAASKEFGPC